MRETSGRLSSLHLALVLLAGANAHAQAEATQRAPSFPAPPPDGYYVADHANIINDADESAAESTCARLMREQNVPLVIVTIESMAAHGFGRLTIDQFAVQLHDYYGSARANWTRMGVLLVVAHKDRKARIEAGADWAGKFNGAASSIMQGTIVPAFRANNYSGGCSAAATAIANAVPSAKTGGGSWSRWTQRPTPGAPGIGCGFGTIVAIIAIIVVLSLIRGATRAVSPWSRGSWTGGYGHRPSGCGGSGFLWGCLAGSLLNSMTRGSSWGGGGRSSGGSWGSRGGFGGGGGATGSW